MEEKAKDITESTSVVKVVKCSNCNNDIQKTDVFCGNCGYPENGTEQEKRKFNYSKKLKQNVIEDAKKKLKNVKIVLYIMAGVNLLALFYYISQSAMAEVIGSIVGAVVFIGCALWVNKKPLIAILSGFGFWILLQILSGIIEPESLFQGLILKIIIISVFIKGIKSAKDYKDFNLKLGLSKS